MGWFLKKQGADMKRFFFFGFWLRRCFRALDADNPGGWRWWKLRLVCRPGLLVFNGF